MRVRVCVCLSVCVRHLCLKRLLEEDQCCCEEYLPREYNAFPVETLVGVALTQEGELRAQAPQPLAAPHDADAQGRDANAVQDQDGEAQPEGVDGVGALPALEARGTQQVPANKEGSVRVGCHGAGMVRDTTR